jgi:hypothetical protein
LAVILLAAGGTLKAEWSEPYFHGELNDPGGFWSAVSPALSSDELTIYFYQHYPPYGVNVLMEGKRDIPEGPFTSKRILTELYNGNEQLGPCVSGDQLRLYYCEWVGEECYIKMAERSSTDEPWADVITFYEIHTDGIPDTSPSLTEDELTMFYRRGPKGDKHIWMATRANLEDPFLDIVEVSELNDPCNTSDNPSILPNGLTIYFSAERDYSESCIYKATRSSVDDLFGNIQILEFCEPDKGESAPYVTPDEKTVYYRGKTTGLWGIYVRYRLETPYEAAIRNIEEAIEEKTEAIGVIDAAIDKETAALEALGELRASGEYEELGLRRLDIFRARTKIMLSMLRQRRAKAELRKGISELEQALELLGIEPEVEPQPSRATKSRNGR